MQIKKYKLHEIPKEYLAEFIELRKKMYEFSYNLPAPMTEHFLSSINNSIDGMDQYVMLAIDNKLLGYLNYLLFTKYENKNFASIEEIYVSESQRRQGIGRKLIDSMHEHLPEHVDTIDYWGMDDASSIPVFGNVSLLPILNADME